MNEAYGDPAVEAMRKKIDAIRSSVQEASSSDGGGHAKRKNPKLPSSIAAAKGYGKQPASQAYGYPPQPPAPQGYYGY